MFLEPYWIQSAYRSVERALLFDRDGSRQSSSTRTASQEENRGKTNSTSSVNETPPAIAEEIVPPIVAGRTTLVRTDTSVQSRMTTPANRHGRSMSNSGTISVSRVATKAWWPDALGECCRWQTTLTRCWTHPLYLAHRSYQFSRISTEPLECNIFVHLLGRRKRPRDDDARPDRAHWHPPILRGMGFLRWGYWLCRTHGGKFPRAGTPVCALLVGTGPLGRAW